MLLRFDPFRGFDGLADQMRDTRQMRSMPLDAYRIGDVFHVDLDLPGMLPDSIEVTVEKNVLSVKAERQWKTEDVETVVCERPTGTFTRELFLGDNLDTDRIGASYENGVLRITIPVAEEAKVRRIAVSTSEAKEAIAASNAG
jgi:HSP20 family protein